MNRQAIRTDQRVKSPALLKGLIYDGAGNRMSPSHAVKKGGQRYLYYVSQAILQGRTQEAGSVARLPAPDLERLVTEAIFDGLAADDRTRVARAQLLDLEQRDRHLALRRVIRKVEVAVDQVKLTIDPSALDHTATDCGIERDESRSDALTTWVLPFKIVPRGGGTRVMLAAGQLPASDASATALLKAFVRGYRWRLQLMNGEARSIADIAKSRSVTVRYVSRLLRLSFLAPDIAEGIINKRLPGSVTLQSVLYSIPCEWNEQRRLFGLGTATDMR